MYTTLIQKTRRFLEKMDFSTVEIAAFQLTF